MATPILKSPFNLDKLTQKFQPPSNRSHHGIDFGAAAGAKAGAKIPAAGAGTVTANAWGDAAGNYVFIRHSNGDVTVYMHLRERSKLKIGAKVKQGQTVGYVGSTGRSTGPHLHFEIRPNGRYPGVDPEKRLRQLALAASSKPALPAGTIWKSSTGNAVKKWQRFANWFIARGLITLPQLAVDGINGPKTQAFTRAFQRLYGLTVDGIAGPKTLAKARKV